jgi:phage shock protein A
LALLVKYRFFLLICQEGLFKLINNIINILYFVINLAQFLLWVSLLVIGVKINRNSNRTPIYLDKLTEIELLRLPHSEKESQVTINTELNLLGDIQVSRQREVIMGIFTRFRDIISSNINAILDKAEDPEKLIKLMIREMEDTLVEIKAACAGAMASAKKVQRQLGTLQDRIQYWEEKAQLAVSRGKDNLAREALVEKRRYTRRIDGLESELSEHNILVEQYQADIRQLEDKLKSARDKQRLLVQRHIHASQKIQAQEEIRRVDSAAAMMKFDELENRIERMESEADLVNYGKQSALDAEFEALGVDEEIEKELQALKTPDSVFKSDETPSSD